MLATVLFKPGHYKQHLKKNLIIIMPVLNAIQETKSKMKLEQLTQSTVNILLLKQYWTNQA